MRFKQSSRYISCDLHGFGDGPPLRNEPLHLIRRGKVIAFGQFFYVDIDYPFHEVPPYPGVYLGHWQNAREPLPKDYGKLWVIRGGVPR